MAFNATKEEIHNIWKKIPDDTQILLTHSPPKGILDRNIDGESQGCEKLLERVQEINPLVHIFGHIHESYGIFPTSSTIFINASSCKTE